MTSFSDVAHAAATRDQEATADLVLDIALKEARDHIRNGNRAAAAARIARAGASADRMLGAQKGRPA